MSSDSNLVRDHPWLGGTTYGTVDSPAQPSMAAIDSLAGPPMATKFAVYGPAGSVVGGTIGGVIGPLGPGNHVALIPPLGLGDYVKERRMPPSRTKTLRY